MLANLLLVSVVGCSFDRAGLRPFDTGTDAADLSVADSRQTVEASAVGDLALSEGPGPDLDGSFDVNRPADIDPVADTKPDAKPAPDIKPAPDTKPAPDLKPPPDTQPPDSKVPCSVKYASVPQLKVCTSTTGCKIYYHTYDGSNVSCSHICGLGSGTCLDGWSDVNNTCTTGTNRGCSYKENDSVCLCSD